MTCNNTMHALTHCDVSPQVFFSLLSDSDNNSDTEDSCLSDMSVISNRSDIPSLNFVDSLAVPSVSMSKRSSANDLVSVYPEKLIDGGQTKLLWKEPAETILVIHKPNDKTVTENFIDVALWLVGDCSLCVYTEANSWEQVHKAATLKANHLCDRLKPFKYGETDLSGKVDLIICLGGDGTLLYASSLFQGLIPPVMAFHMGSLGFLTPFEIDDFKKSIRKVLKGKASFILRSRLKCSLIQSIETQMETESPKLKHALNEVVVDRGSAAFICNLDLFIDNHYVTSVQGDGLIVSTPTGSTAYAMAAGASMIHPSVPAILIAPINAHSLSFRPVVLPAGVQIKLALSPNARNTAWVSIDGRDRQELNFGDSVLITTSNFPVASICKKDHIHDWFSGLAQCLHWNVRKAQLGYSDSNSDQDSESRDLTSISMVPVTQRKASLKAKLSNNTDMARHSSPT